MPEIVRRSEPKAAIRCRWPYGGIHYSAGRRGEAMDTDVRSVGNCSVDLSAQFGRSPSRSRVHGKASSSATNGQACRRRQIGAGRRPGHCTRFRRRRSSPGPARFRLDGQV